MSIRDNAFSESHFSKELFYFLSMRGANRVFISMSLGVMGGLTYAGLIPLILTSVKADDVLLSEFLLSEKAYFLDYEIAQPKFALAFIAVCIVALVFRAVSQIVLNGVVVESTSELRVYICERIHRLPIQTLEKIGPSRFISALTLDVPTLVNGASYIPMLIVNTSIVFGTLVFIALLDVEIFWLTLAVMTFGIVSYRIPFIFGQRFFKQAREKYDDIQESIRGFIYGAKELKLNRNRYQGYKSSGLDTAEGDYVRLQVRGGWIVYLAVQYGNLIGFLAVGIIVYAAANFYSLSNQVLVSVVVAMLYMIGPLGIIMNTIVPYTHGVVALKKLKGLLNEMPEEETGSDFTVLPCDTLRLKRVGYRYAGADGFSIGPIDLTLNKGQISFVVGGNGSGKSTLAKIVSNHYVPTAGDIFYDNVRIAAGNRSGARENTSSIYTDFYLFTRLYGFSQADLRDVNDYLKKLDLQDKVSLDGDRFSTINLSDGQRKRLALLVSYLEDRRVYVFDEWAADQDPDFKQVFYCELLPELRQRGKIVFVVAHDEKYFSVADQLITMEQGRVIDISHNDQCTLSEASA